MSCVFRPPIGSISVHVPGPDNLESSQSGPDTQFSENISPTFSRICPTSLSGMANRRPQRARMGSGERECWARPGHVPECRFSHTGGSLTPTLTPKWGFFSIRSTNPSWLVSFASGKRTLAFYSTRQNAPIGVNPVKLAFSGKSV